jgi:extradiol dioxygenase family protein
VNQPIFHLAFAVNDLDAARRFYIDILGARPGRVREKWADVHLFGAQITLHLNADEVPPKGRHGVRHFGATLPWPRWETLAAELAARGVRFASEPAITLAGTPEEQAKLYLCDPSGNLVEIKAYRNPAAALEIEHAGGLIEA